MKKLGICFKVILTTLLVCIAGVAFGQEVPAPDVDYNEFISFLLTALGGWKGATTMAVVASVIQIAMKLFQTQAGELLGKYKLLAVSLLSLAGTIIGLTLTGVSFGVAALHGTSLAAIQVFLHQLYKQFFEKND